MEAFGEGVLAVINATVALELKAPRGSGIAALWPLAPVLLSDVLSSV